MIDPFAVLRPSLQFRARLTHYRPSGPPAGLPANGPTGTTGTGVPAVAMASNGQFVVAWQNGSSLALAIYQLNGTLIATPSPISLNFSNSPYATTGHLLGVAADAVGDFAVLYAGKGDRWTVPQPTVQRYTKSGSANGNAITVATPRLSNYDAAMS